jgi:hypothetical protein
MGALTSLDLSKSKLTRGTFHGRNGGENPRSFDNNYEPDDMSGVATLADAIRDNGAICTVTVNTFPLPIQDIRSKAELDFAGKGLKVEDAIIIAALIPFNVS